MDSSLQRLIANTVPENERGRVFGDLNGLRGLISFPAPILGALLFEKYGFQAPILANLILSIVVVPLLFSIKEE